MFFPPPDISISEVVVRIIPVGSIESQRNTYSGDIEKYNNGLRPGEDAKF